MDPAALARELIAARAKQQAACLACRHGEHDVAVAIFIALHWEAVEVGLAVRASGGIEAVHKTILLRGNSFVKGKYAIMRPEW